MRTCRLCRNTIWGESFICGECRKMYERFAREDVSALGLVDWMRKIVRRSNSGSGWWVERRLRP